jgi:hypothetical protein
LLHRTKSAYIFGSGEVLRAAISGGYLAKVLRELRPIRAYGFAVASWLAILLFLLLTRNWAWSLALLLASCVLSVLGMALRRRSINRGIYSVLVWHVQGFGLVRGVLRRRRSPTETISSRVVRISVPCVNTLEAQAAGLR